MNHIYLIRLVVLKRPSFHSQKLGMPTLKQQRCSVVHVFQVCCAKGFQFGSHLGDFRFGGSGCKLSFNS